MPGTDELPEDLAPLTHRNAFELHDSSWGDDIRRLITVIERVIKATSAAAPDVPEVKRPSKKLLWWAAGGILMLAAIASLYGLYQITQITNSPPDGKLSDITVNYDDEFFYVNFKAEIEGYPAGEKCEVRWTMYDAKTQEKLPGPKFQDQKYIYPDRYWTKSLAIRVPTPEESGDYYVKLELFAPDKSGESKLLDVEKSETIQFRAFKFELG